MKRFSLPRSPLLLAVLLLTSAIVACTATVEPPVSATRHVATVAPTTPAEVEATQPTAMPTASPEMEVEAVPTALPEPTLTIDPELVEAQALPVLDTVELTLVDHAGGVPRAVAVVGTTAYITFGPRLLVYDVGDPAAPALLGQSAPLGDIINDVVVSGQFAFLAAGRAGLVVLDVANPANITVVNAGPGYTGANRPAAERIALAGDRLFVTNFDRQNGDTSLLWFDAADPANVSFTEAINLQSSDTAVFGSDRFLIVGNGRLEVRLVAAPEATVGRVTLTGASYAGHAVLIDDIAHVAISGDRSGFVSYDVSDPATPQQMGDFAPIEFFFVNPPVGDGETLVTVSTFGEFGHCGSQIFVVGVGEKLSELTQFDPENCSNRLALHDGTLYVLGRAGVQLYDMSTPAEPRLQTTLLAPAGFLDAPGFALDPGDAGRAYVRTDNGRTFDVVTVNLDGGAITPTGERLAIGSRTLLDIFAVGETLVVPQWMGGLTTLGSADGGLQVLYEPEEYDLVAGDHYAIARSGTTLYTPIIDHKDLVDRPAEGLIGAVGAVDLSDPSRPVVRGLVETGESQVISLTTGGDTLYALNQGQVNQVVIIDIADRLAPQIIARLPIPEPASRLAVVGDTLYITCDQWNCHHLYTVDVSDQAQPVLNGRWRLPFGVQDIVTGPGNLLILATIDEGFGVLDVSDPARPALIGAQPTPPTFMRLVVAGDTLYAAAYDAGLYIFHIER